jgi:hypothetical protein
MVAELGLCASEEGGGCCNSLFWGKTLWRSCCLIVFEICVIYNKQFASGESLQSQKLKGD